MTTILVDNEPDGIRTLKKLLELHCPGVKIAATCSNAREARQKLEEIRPDVIFLDIHMSGESGLEMMEELSAKKIEVVFVTAHSEYILQALQFGAVDYLMKPVDEDHLVEAVERVRQRLSVATSADQGRTLIPNIKKAGYPSEMRLYLPNLKGFAIVKQEEIIYCEANRSYTVFHFIDHKPIRISKPLVDYDRLLTETSFLRVHKSFLINILHVRKYKVGNGGTVTMSDGAVIDVSRRKKEQFLSKAKDYYKSFLPD